MARRICWTEGEADADRLWSLGFPATTCAGGSESWRPHADDYISQLVAAGCAELIVFQDNDIPGARLARAVCRAAMDVGLKVKLIPAFVDCGPKADISTWLDAGRTKEELLALIEATPWLTELPLEPGQTAPVEPDPSEGEWPEAGPYLVKGGVLCRKRGSNGDWPEPLCNFRARVTEELLLDDAVTVTRMFAIDGWREDGVPLPQIRVPVSKFPAMSWIMEEWGIRASLRAGQGTKDFVREAMQRLSRPGFRRLYTHTGWRRLPGGEWVYLTATGAVGREGFEVDLGRLERYKLPPIPDKARMGTQTGLELLDVAPWSVTVPLLGSIYRAVLGGVLPSDYSLWLEGPTGNYKSSLAALFLCHWGGFTKLTLPENWSSSPNFLERAAFILKDAWLVVDDYHPSTMESRQQEQTATRLIRSQGNLSGRGRLRQDLSVQTTFVPRGLIVGTGEQHPGGQSLVGRMLVLEIEWGKVRMPLLTKLQRSAWLLPHALAGFVEWLAPQMETIRVVLLETFEQAREAALSVSKRHARIPEIVANCWLGIRALADYAKDIGALSDIEAERLQDRAWGALLDVAEDQHAQVEDERPSRRFFRVLVVLLLQSHARLTFRTKEETVMIVRPPDLVGWYDADYLYLLPEASFQLVSRFAKDTGEAIGLRQSRLFQDMDREGLVERGPDSFTTVVRAGGQPRRVVKIRRASLEKLLGVPFVIHGEGESSSFPFEEM